MGTGISERSPGNSGPDRTGNGGDYPRVGNKTYGYICLWKGCPASKEFGAAKIQSEVQAAKHHRRFPHHTIAMYVKEITHVFTESTTPLNLDTPPF